MRALFGLCIIMSMWVFNVQAWQVALEKNKSGEYQQIMVGNTETLKNVKAYLAWHDQDAKDDQRFMSWTIKSGWQAGVEPISPSTLTFEPFKTTKLAMLPKACPEQHACFLIMVTTRSDANVLDSKNWQSASVLPLTAKAATKRLPGQQFFLDSAYDYTRDMADEDGGTTEGNEPSIAPEPPTAAPAEKTDELANDTESSGAKTEKPDLFKLVDNQLLYANGQAERFQIIDLTDPANPTLIYSIALSGSPRELYVLGGYYILLQSTYLLEEEGTYITVFGKNAEGAFEVVQDLTLEGRFVESRRRDRIIYAVTEKATYHHYMPKPLFLETVDFASPGVEKQAENPPIMVDALLVTENGKLESVDQQELTGYAPMIAIFTDYLVVANKELNDWRSTQIQVFDLTFPNNPLPTPAEVTVPGQVPSEFHLSVKDQKLHVVYGPADREDGSSLAIYNLMPTKPTLMGKVDKIAPGEALFATRFHGDRAFVVTYERTDPLWVIDIADSTQPKIVGELHIPGWSEKMFFHEDQLFAVGYHDQLEADEPEDKRVRRIAVSLFDVADPTQPTLLSRFVPLANQQINYSYSPAVNDERALLLDWPQSFAALPLSSWEKGGGNFLQIVDIQPTQLTDAGLVKSPVNLQRSFSIQPDILGALGDQALLTLRWGQGEPEVLGNLELASNLAWIDYQAGSLWVASMSNRGLHRFYRYDPNNLDEPLQNWQLEDNYSQLALDDNKAVFYNVNNGSPDGKIQQIDLTTGEIQPVQILSEAGNTHNAWYQDGWLHAESWEHTNQPILDEEQVDEDIKVDTTISSIMPAHLSVEMPPGRYNRQKIMRSWQVSAPENPPVIRLIPGSVMGFTAEGDVVTQEYVRDAEAKIYASYLHLHTLRLTENGVVLKSSYQPTLCEESYPNTVMFEGKIYISCLNAIKYFAEPQEGDPVSNTLLVRLNPSENFAEEGRWTFNDYQPLQLIKGDIAILSSRSSTPIRTRTSMPYPYYNKCNAYRLGENGQTVFLNELPTCPWQNSIAFSPEKAWIAKGFAGIEAVGLSTP